MEQLTQAFDIKRMLIGDESPLFLLEIAVRTLVIYTYTLALLRWLGSRAIGQLSTVEFLLVIGLGSAVGDAMFYSDVPLLHAMVVITIVVVANRVIDLLIAKSTAVEKTVDGRPREAVRDGVVCSDFVKRGTLGRGELFQQLRENGVRNLGQVEHAYVETDGVITVFKAEKANEGLSIVPPPEIERPPLLDAPDPHAVCTRCGAHPRQGDALCGNCGGDQWTAASS